MRETFRHEVYDEGYGALTVWIHTFSGFNLLFLLSMKKMERDGKKQSERRRKEESCIVQEVAWRGTGFKQQEHTKEEDGTKDDRRLR